MSFPDTTAQSTAIARDSARTLFAHTMTLVAITAAFFAGGAYLGRDMSRGAGIIWFIAAIACLFGMRAATARSEQLTIGLLLATGWVLALPLVTHPVSMLLVPATIVFMLATRRSPLWMIALGAVVGAFGGA